MSIITFYWTIYQILVEYKDGSLTQFTALDALERLNERGKSLGLSISPNVILLNNPQDYVDTDLTLEIISNENNSDDDSYTCDDCGVEIEDGDNYCSSCQQERDDQREADRREEELEDNRIITTRRG